MSTTTIAAGDAALEVTRTGAGPRAVLLHAGIADSRMWRGLVPALEPTHEVLRYDLRGYGRTALPPGPFRHVDDLAAVIAATGGGPVDLVGASLGGRVALDLALEKPQLVRSLVLLGAVVAGFEPDVDPPPLWDDMVDAHRAGDLDRLADVEARTWLADPDGKRVPPELLDLVREMDRIALANERSGVAEELEPELAAVERLAELRVPVLVVVGELDQPDIHLAADLLAHEVTGARRVVVPDTAHLPALERPEAVGDLVAEFLSSQG